MEHEKDSQSTYKKSSNGRGGDRKITSGTSDISRKFKKLKKRNIKMPGMEEAHQNES